ncbi:MAG TPA: hypothetical protein VGO11_08670 [Chthoniobacteraceae bacterium]|jgi:hypothetical protein|nr:hypothetical protein [Chthoniobacteraceae bacterium]
MKRTTSFLTALAAAGLLAVLGQALSAADARSKPPVPGSAATEGVFESAPRAGGGFEQAPDSVTRLGLRSSTMKKPDSLHTRFGLPVATPAPFLDALPGTTTR